MVGTRIVYLERKLLQTFGKARKKLVPGAGLGNDGESRRRGSQISASKLHTGCFAGLVCEGARGRRWTSQWLDVCDRLRGWQLTAAYLRDRVSARIEGTEEPARVRGEMSVRTLGRNCFVGRSWW
jgi:hypothetical protein